MLLVISQYSAAQEASDERIPLLFTNGMVKCDGVKLDSCTVIAIRITTVYQHRSQTARASMNSY